MNQNNRYEFIKTNRKAVNLTLILNTLQAISNNVPYKHRNQLFYNSLKNPMTQELFLKNYNETKTIEQILKINLFEQIYKPVQQSDKQKKQYFSNLTDL